MCTWKSCYRFKLNTKKLITGFLVKLFSVFLIAVSLINLERSLLSCLLLHSSTATLCLCYFLKLPFISSFMFLLLQLSHLSVPHQSHQRKFVNELCQMTTLKWNTLVTTTTKLLLLYYRYYHQHYDHYRYHLDCKILTCLLALWVLVKIYPAFNHLIDFLKIITNISLFLTIIPTTNI